MSGIRKISETKEKKATNRRFDEDIWYSNRYLKRSNNLKKNNSQGDTYKYIFIGWLKEKSCKMHTIGPQSPPEAVALFGPLLKIFVNTFLGNLPCLPRLTIVPAEEGWRYGLANITVRRHGVSRVVTSHQPPGLLIAREQGSDSLMPLMQ